MDEGLILPAHYQRERRKLAERRKAAFAKEPTGPSQVRQLDFSEYEPTAGGTWRIVACRGYWSKYEFDAHASPTANMHDDAIEAVEKALTAACPHQGAHAWAERVTRTRLRVDEVRVAVP